MCEILAPAGGKNSATAAINAGADAIYLGLSDFSARSSAENFNMAEFKEICGYAHAFEVKVYVALNTVVKDCELKKFFNTAVEAWNCGADALIIQDIFLGKYLKSKFSQIVLHLSTQAGTCNEYGARLAKEYGFDRVIVARETKISNIEKISKIIETEVFVQGALCTCFSGQCYMSSFAGGNSGNRGRCKQPCRKLYSIDRRGFEEEAYRLSLSDLCVGESIREFIRAGVKSFKIEGRMRRQEYVAAAVGYYKSILNDERADLMVLKRTFNRGNYTNGLAFGQDKSFISSAVQGHIGEYVGVIKVENSKYVCLSSSKFSAGDGFKILRGGKEVGGGCFGGEAKGGFVVSSRDRLKNGDKVFITTDTALNKRLLENKRLIDLDISAKFYGGMPAEVVINGKVFKGKKELQYAQNRPLSIEDIEDSFNKIDIYPFRPRFKEVLTDNAFLPKSELNSLRREIYAEYYAWRSESKNKVIEANFGFETPISGQNVKTAVICTNLNSVTADIGILKLDSFSVDIESFLSAFRGEKYLFVPPYMTGEEVLRIKELCKDFDGIYCDSYFGLLLARELGVAFFAGTGFNITNALSLSQCKVKYIAVSKELTQKEAENLSAHNTFYLVGGNIKVMDLIYCPFEKKCADCDKRTDYTLTDSEGRKFPLRRYKTSECRFEVFNCADLSVKNCAMGKLFDLTLSESAGGFKASLDLNEYEKSLKNITRGHSVKGIE